jgi:hypothetical protein
MNFPHRNLNGATRLNPARRLIWMSKVLNH